MENELKIIYERELLGKEFKIYGDFENPLFLAKDIAEWINYAKTSNESYDVSNMLKTVDEGEKTIRKIFISSKIRDMWFLTEYGFYEICMQSTKPIAKQFKKEVKHILKLIRKTRVNLTDNVFNKLLNDPKKLLEIIFKYEEEMEKLKNENKELKTQIENVYSELERVSIQSSQLKNIGFV